MLRVVIMLKDVMLFVSDFFSGVWQHLTTKYFSIPFRVQCPVDTKQRTRAVPGEATPHHYVAASVTKGFYRFFRMIRLIGKAPDVFNAIRIIQIDSGLIRKNDFYPPNDGCSQMFFGKPNARFNVVRQQLPNLPWSPGTEPSVV